MQGRPPKSKALNAAQGNPRRAKQPSEADESYDVDSEPETPETIILAPPPPDWLATDSDASALAVNAWNTLVQVLIDNRRLANTDLSALARYCRYLGEWVECTKSVDKYGVVICAPGTDIPKHRNPAFLARQQIEKDMLQQEKELGLTPKARTALQRQLLAALDDLPHVGRTANQSRKGGPVGWLNEE